MSKLQLARGQLWQLTWRVVNQLAYQAASTQLQRPRKRTAMPLVQPVDRGPVDRLNSSPMVLLLVGWVGCVAWWVGHPRHHALGNHSSELVDLAWNLL